MKRGASSRMERSRSSSQSSTLARVLNLSLPSALLHDPAVPGGRGVRLSALLSDLCCTAVAECHGHVCVRVRGWMGECMGAWVVEWVGGVLQDTRLTYVSSDTSSPTPKLLLPPPVGLPPPLAARGEREVML